MLLSLNEISLGGSDISLSSNDISLNLNDISFRKNDLSLSSNDISLSSNDILLRENDNSRGAQRYFGNISRLLEQWPRDISPIYIVPTEISLRYRRYLAIIAINDDIRLHYFCTVLYVFIIYMEKYEKARASSGKIIYSNRAFGQNNRVRLKR